MLDHVSTDTSRSGRRRRRFKLNSFLHSVELAAFRIVVTASFLYCLYHVFMREIGR